MTVRSFRDLRVWQSGMDFAVAVYELTRLFPRQETYGLSSQLQRAAASVPANIAEGRHRNHAKEYLQFIAIARGSLAEAETYLELAHRLGYASMDQVGPIMNLSGQVSRQLFALQSSMNQPPGGLSPDNTSRS